MEARHMTPPPSESNHPRAIPAKERPGTEVFGGRIDRFMAYMRTYCQRAQTQNSALANKTGAERMGSPLLRIESGSRDGLLHDLADGVQAESVWTGQVIGFLPNGTATMRPAPASRFCFSRRINRSMPSSQKVTSSMRSCARLILRRALAKPTRKIGRASCRER